MELPLPITVHNTEVDPPARELIRRYGAKLGQFYDRLNACHVRVDVVTRKRSATLHDGIQSAFEAATRRLQDYAVRQRAAVKRPAGRGAESGR